MCVIFVGLNLFAVGALLGTSTDGVGLLFSVSAVAAVGAAVLVVVAVVGAVTSENDGDDFDERGKDKDEDSSVGDVAMGAAMLVSVLEGSMQCCGDSVENRKAKCMSVSVLRPVLSRAMMGRVNVPWTWAPRRYFARELNGSIERPT